MIAIRKQTVDKAEKIEIANNAIGFTYINKLPYLQISYDNYGFNIKFTVFESNPVTTQTIHQSPVHLDSCIELFMNFNPSDSDKYINFEVNSNGIMFAALRKNRFEKRNLLISEIYDLHITTKSFAVHWIVKYIISFDLIKKYYPSFDISRKNTMKGNIYKSGEYSNPEHYLMYCSILFDLRRQITQWFNLFFLITTDCLSLAAPSRRIGMSSSFYTFVSIYKNVLLGWKLAVIKQNTL